MHICQMHTLTQMSLSIALFSDEKLKRQPAFLLTTTRIKVAKERQQKLKVN